MKHSDEKQNFADRLKHFAKSLPALLSSGGSWTMRGFIDIFKNVYALSSDTKVISKILELHLFPHFVSFARDAGYEIELASFQNWYPDLTFVDMARPDIRFAVDLKTTYRDDDHTGFCNGFTLGSHGEYFINRSSTKNIQYPYGSYAGHFCLGVIYTRERLDTDYETKVYTAGDVADMPAVISGLICFAEEKWRIASDKGGSGNTANIGSIKKIDDIVNGRGVFSKAGERLFDEYWMNFGKIELFDGSGKNKKITSFKDYLVYRGLPVELYTPPASKRDGHGR